MLIENACYRIGDLKDAFCITAIRPRLGGMWIFAPVDQNGKLTPLSSDDGGVIAWALLDEPDPDGWEEGILKITCYPDGSWGIASLLPPWWTLDDFRLMLNKSDVMFN